MQPLEGRGRAIVGAQSDDAPAVLDGGPFDLGARSDGSKSPATTRGAFGKSLISRALLFTSLEQPDTSRTLILARLEKKSRHIAAMQDRPALHQRELTRLTDILRRHDDQSGCTPAGGREAARASLIAPPVRQGRRNAAGTR
ncbi:hypothetical protein J7E70_16420 [Variovorax paradoxus]|nr:hypothetical protein [Variovorax paradoxus]MBT2323692.1 hypothetical protein [Variovorax paradoxus]